MLETTGTSASATDHGSFLSRYARDLYQDSRLVPLLRRLMTVSCELTSSAGSSISIIDHAGGRYTKVAERGTACRLGQSFPLDEGVTGRVMAHRQPVVLARYQDVRSGHLSPGSPAREGAVAAIPIWWRGEVIGANVVFAGGPRTFSAKEVEQLEVLTQVVAPGIVTAAGRDLAMADLLRWPEPPQEPGAAPGRPPSTSSVAEVTLGLAALAARAGLSEHGSLHPLQVRVVREEAALRLEVRGVGEHGSGWRQVVDGVDGTVELLSAEGPSQATDPAHGGSAPVSPLTAREHQVAALLSRGMSDRAIAEALLISPKTAEKHVGAVLRKTGTTCRTAAVVRALEQGWLGTDVPRATVSRGEFPPWDGRAGTS
jgi:DNA-binding CsgD family transcriptional regulator